MSIINRYLNQRLIDELEALILRVPKDLLIWKRELKKLNKKRKLTRKEKRIQIEYRHEMSYYIGKMFAYAYVLDQLGDNKFTKIYFYKKFKVKMLNKERGQVSFKI